MEIPVKTIMRVAARSDVKKLSAAIAAALNDNTSEGELVLSCMGAEAVNQAVKSVAFLQRFTFSRISVTPSFESDDKNACTRILLEVSKV